jgi:hypothetical protein
MRNEQFEHLRVAGACGGSCEITIYSVSLTLVCTMVDLAKNLLQNKAKFLAGVIVFLIRSAGCMLNKINRCWRTGALQAHGARFVELSSNTKQLIS